MLDALELDEDEIVNSKMDKNEVKYPVDKAKGNSLKYNELWYKTAEGVIGEEYGV